jgi:hypothetical protein
LQSLVWLWEPDLHWRGLITDLWGAKFAVRHCSGLHAVWKDLLVGRTGVLVGDFTGVTAPALPDKVRLCALSRIAPVLLLVEEPALAHLAATDAGACNVLFRPFDDLDRLFAAVDELSKLAPRFSTPALSAF